MTHSSVEDQHAPSTGQPQEHRMRYIGRGAWCICGSPWLGDHCPSAPSTGQPGEVADVLDTTMEPVDAARSVPLAPAGLDRRVVCFHGVVVSTGQPAVDLEAIRRRHPRAFDERWALIPGSPNSDIHQLTAEVESLKQQNAAGRQTQASLLSNMESYALEIRGLQIQLIAAQAERDEFKQGLEVAEFEQGFANVWRENERLRAQVDWLKQEHADMHPACSAEPGYCPHEAQAEAMRGVLEGWQEYWLHDRECQECHRVRRLGQACWEQVQRFERVWTAGKAAPAAATAGQPTTPSNRPHPAPSANDSPTQAQPEVRNAGASESRPGTLVKGKVVHYFTPRFSNPTLCAACDCALGNPWHANAAEAPGE